MSDQQYVPFNSINSMTTKNYFKKWYSSFITKKIKKKHFIQLFHGTYQKIQSSVCGKAINLENKFSQKLSEAVN